MTFINRRPQRLCALRAARLQFDVANEAKLFLENQRESILPEILYKSFLCAAGRKFRDENEKSADKAPDYAMHCHASAVRKDVPGKQR